MNENRWLNATEMLKQASWWIGLILFLILILLIEIRATDAKAQDVKPEDKLSYRLQLLVQPTIKVQDARTRAQKLSLPVSGPGSLLMNDQDELLVYIGLSDLSESNLEMLRETGAKIVHVAKAYKIVTAYVNVDQLTSVAALATVVGIQEELTPSSGVTSDQQVTERNATSDPKLQVGCTSATTSEGDTQLNAIAARNTFGLDGSGVIVGVLSDSYDNHSNVPNPPPTDAAADIVSGDLPGPGNPCGRITSVNIITDTNARTDEGRAMLQIVHDLAPGADLAFASGFSGIFDFGDQIRALRNNAVADVIVDDIFYFNDPFFQDGPITLAIQEVTANGALYFTLAGNHHEVVNGNEIGSYEAPAYRPTTCPAALGLSGDCHDFDSGSGTDSDSSFTLDADGELHLDFQWAEPWYGVQTDLNIYLVDSSDTIAASSQTNNPGALIPMPFEFFSYTNSTGSSQDLHLVINRASGTDTPRLKHILLQDTHGLSSVEYNTSGGGDIVGPTVYGHSGTNAAIGVAAVPYNDSDGPETFSSRGFPTYYFGPVEGNAPAASLIAPDTRQKPDLAATDGGHNTFFGQNVNGLWRFYGTSAAAPHAAAIAALLKHEANQQNAPLNQSIVEFILETTATTMTSGSPEANGAGLVNAFEAANYINANPLFEILNPTTISTAYAGNPANPQKIIVSVTKPENSLISDRFAVTISGTVATIVTLYEGSDRYVLEVMPPSQNSEGLYDLSVSVTASAGLGFDTKSDAIHYANANNVDVMLVIDHSGSMGSQNKLEDAKNAAAQFVDLMNDNDKIGVASFDHLATLNYGLTTVTPATKVQAQDAINLIAVGGSTSIGGGLLVGQNELTGKGNALHPWAIVLLSDGLENTAPFVADVLPNIKSTKTVIHTIAFGTDADEVGMRDIAAQTGGTYNFAPAGQGQELAGVYNTIAGAVSGQQTLVSFSGVIQQGATDQRQVAIDSTVEQATFSISWSNSASSLELTLEDPNGVVIDQGTATSNSDVDFVSGSTYQYYRIISPTLVSGTWKMKVTNGTINKSGRETAVTANEEQYTAQVTGQTNLNLRAYFYQPSYQANEPIKLSITLSDDQPIQDAQVLAVVGPLFQASPTRAVSDTFMYLFDDGQHSDGLASDGVYANILDASVTDTDGTYTFSVFATGTANNGQTFARLTQQSLFIGTGTTVTFFEGVEFPRTVYLPLLIK